MTEEELIPALATPPGNEIARPRVSSHDNAPLVEFAQEPDAETEPGANVGDTLQPVSNDFNTPASEDTAVVNSVATINGQAASSHKDPPLQEEESALAPGASIPSQLSSRV